MLYEQIKKDLMTAMKERNAVKKDLLQVLMSKLNLEIKEHKVEMTDEKVMDAISKELKVIKQGKEDLQKIGRQEAINKADQEISILEGYLPKQLTEAEVEDVVKQTITELNITSGDAKQKGLLMKSVMTKIKGQADGKLVNSIVAKLM